MMTSTPSSCWKGRPSHAATVVGWWFLLVPILSSTSHCSFLAVVNAFRPPQLVHSSSRASTTSWKHKTAGVSFSLDAKKSKRKNNDDPEESGPGMADAFRQLEQLQSLDLEASSSESPIPFEQQKKKKQDQAFQQAMKELNLSDLPAVTPESEAELYKDMATELSVASSEQDLIADFKSDLINDNDDLLASRDAKNEKFMNQAIQEALEEAKEQNADVDKESLLDNKEIMAEIEKIFDRANEKLLEGLEEIRAEQMSLARESAERNSKASQAKIEEDELRLAMAEANMKKMLAKVNEETRNVEDAIRDLERAQKEAEGGLDSQLSSLKSGGLIKQASLVGALLFTMRSGFETFGFISGDPTHAMPALIQGALAIVCFVAFLFL